MCAASLAGSMLFLRASMTRVCPSTSPWDATAIRGVTPSLSMKSNLAPFSMRSFMESVLPPLAASKSAVPPLLCSVLTAAPPFSIKIFITSFIPEAAAYINAVTPLPEVASTAAPASKRYVTASLCPLAAAMMSALNPVSENESTYVAPLSSGSFPAFVINAFSRSTFPFSAAFIRGVSPSLSLALGSAPFSNKRLTTSACPPMDAECSAVIPSSR
mmetsp:Transcript_12255/g.17097  ORF Transcript_12255/g.17097 Transcript_12255/m.17097 type:complete len:216 (-) Transcript_12255:991-1638(-)